MATNSNFIVKNGLSIGANTIIAANGVWVSATTNILGPQGPQGVQGAQGIQGTQGIIGVQGAQGFQGAQGVQGIQGSQGPQGIQGATGAQGIQGTAGVQGAQGVQGAAGVQGAQGVQGVLGAQGRQGAQGVQGVAGFQGALGIQGAQGVQGVVGAQGVQGAQGIQGAQGTIAGNGNVYYQVWSTHGGTGSTTQYGAYPTDSADFSKFFNLLYTNSTLASSGTSTPSVVLDWQVYTTLTGNGITVPNSGNYFAVMVYGTFCPKETGTYTFTAESDDSIDLFINGVNVASFYGGRGTPALGTTTGTIILTANVSYTFRARMQENGGGEGMRVYWKKPSQSAGATWYQDATELGLSGVPGVTGSQGPTGVAGIQGATGSAGFQGRQGVQGAQGTTGVTGAQGTTGSAGFQGRQGVQGGTGPAGFQGPQGVQGSTGLSGAQGPQGSTGTGGAQGPQGAQGPAGSGGAQGPQGAQGPAGSGGAQGPQGAQGPTGSPGAQGPQGGSGGASSQVSGLGVNTAAAATEVRATSSITAYFSDRRLKDIEGNIQNALEKLGQLNGVYYEQNDVAKKAGYNNDGERQIGLIAQQTQKVLPEVIKPAPFDTDKYGCSISGENYLTIQYEKIVPLLIEALKEQKEQIDYIKQNIQR